MYVLLIAYAFSFWKTTIQIYGVSLKKTNILYGLSSYYIFVFNITLIIIHL